MSANEKAGLVAGTVRPAGVTASDEARPDSPRRLTPTERAHEIMLAALHRTPVKASEEVEVTRNAKGDYQYRVAGVAGEDESLEKVAKRVMSLVKDMDSTLPLSRVQEAGRKYTADELGKTKR